MVQLIRRPRQDFIIVAFDRNASETRVFPRRQMIATTDETLTDNGIRSQGLPEVMALWNAKPQP